MSAAPTTDEIVVNNLDKIGALLPKLDKTYDDIIKYLCFGDAITFQIVCEMVYISTMNIVTYDGVYINRNVPIVMLNPFFDLSRLNDKPIVDVFEDDIELSRYYKVLKKFVKPTTVMGIDKLSKSDYSDKFDALKRFKYYLCTSGANSTLWGLISLINCRKNFISKRYEYLSFTKNKVGIVKLLDSTIDTVFNNKAGNSLAPLLAIQYPNLRIVSSGPILRLYDGNTMAYEFPEMTTETKQLTLSVLMDLRSAFCGMTFDELIDIDTSSLEWNFYMAYANKSGFKMTTTFTYYDPSDNLINDVKLVDKKIESYVRNLKKLRIATKVASFTEITFNKFSLIEELKRLLYEATFNNDMSLEDKVKLTKWMIAVFGSVVACKMLSTLADKKNGDVSTLVDKKNGTSA